MASQPLSAARQQVLDRLAEGDAQGALDLARQLQQQFPQDRRTSLVLARALVAAGDTPAASAELAKVTSALPDEREGWALLAECGSEAAPGVLADLPPLARANGSRAPISAAALGHLYARQYLATHCTAQLDPVWRADATRLDVGVALAEAHWRLGETAPAEEICRTILRAAPECLKANLILAQQLWAEGRRNDASALVATARAVDPENAVAEDLYEWLAVRDADAVPLRLQAVLVELPEEPVTAPAPEPAGVPPQIITEQLRPLEGVLGGLPPIEPIPQPEPFWERPGGEVTPADAAAAAAAEVTPDIEAVAAEPPVPEIAPAPPAQLAAAAAAAEVVPDVEAVAPELAPEEFLPAFSTELSLAGTSPEAETPPPTAVPVEQPEVPAVELQPVTSEAEPEFAPPEAAYAEASGDFQPAPLEPDLAQTAPEPAYAPVEAAAQHPEPLKLRWLEVTNQGQLVDLPSAPEGYRAAVGAWDDCCRRLGAAFNLGQLRGGSVESTHGALHALCEADSAVVAIAPAGANVGLVRTKLRQIHHSS